VKTRSVGAELFRADRQTDRNDDAISSFSQFCQSAYRYFYWNVNRFFSSLERP